ncbi:hypothetical protein A9Q84_04870 [Halobacteriovorax marinus]|uniref:Uncharacterized protein n=1 Tax=Halobacteriovorax marinus TaxID=97084 RepID=A0A1Y5FB18_9BACT|nr:hypothetical protein A9Q84_04870 [Halobacteriovorax marinus]
MKIYITLFILISCSLSFSKEFSCKDIKERELKVNNSVTIQIQNIDGVCSFGVITSKASKKFNYSPHTHKAFRKWTFQSSGKILILNSFQSGPTDSSSTSYKAYQTFPNHHELKLKTSSDGSFSMSLPNGTSVFFNDDGSFNQSKTTDLKIKDIPITIPDIPKSKSEERYNELSHLSYKDPKKVGIRVFHRQKYAAQTSRSIGFETKKGMYIPLGVEMGKIPGNSTSKSYTLFGIDDQKLCKKKMPAHFYFNYLVKCSTNKPNSRCACKQTNEEANELFKINESYEKELTELKFKIFNSTGTNRLSIEKRIEELKILISPNIFKEVYFYCSLDRNEAKKFVSNRKIAKDHREIEGVKVKDTSSVIKKLISSGQCPRLKSIMHDCVDCRKDNLMETKSIDKTLDQINDVLESVKDVMETVKD